MQRSICVNAWIPSAVRPYKISRLYAWMMRATIILWRFSMNMPIVTAVFLLDKCPKTQAMPQPATKV